MARVNYAGEKRRKVLEKQKKKEEKKRRKLAQESGDSDATASASETPSGESQPVATE